MSYIADGDVSQVIWDPDELTGAVFGPDVLRVGHGYRDVCLAWIGSQALDARGINYELTREGESPWWTLTLRLTQAEATESVPAIDYELPINIVWRLTEEFGEIEYLKVGRYEQMMDGLTSAQRRELN